jgi:hypothetical protein
LKFHCIFFFDGCCWSRGAAKEEEEAVVVPLLLALSCYSILLQVAMLNPEKTESY